TPRVDRFVYRVLADLTQVDASTQRLRETLAAFLRARGNLDQTAAALFVHRNTVRYRMHQIEDLLGASINKLGGELDVALQHFQVHHEN
ncbi:MAG: helix-turn-helix domain-containing protein, partial [Nocardioidaceae bacterium]|nr:helix-turn-helix domain-containing protein [Nocardioidaceae bacterium]